MKPNEKWGLSWMILAASGIAAFKVLHDFPSTVIMIVAYLLGMVILFAK